MSGFEVLSGRRYFDDNCDHAAHQPGDRHRSVGLLHQEWTGEVWAPVCPSDDVPMRGHDGSGWLICQVCRRTYRELVGRVRS